MTDETDTPSGQDMTINVARSVVVSQAKGQLRILLSAVAGAIAGSTFGHRYLPPDMFSQSLLDAIAALIIYGLAAGWQWVRIHVQWNRLWGLANNPRVPDDLVRPAPIKGVAP